MPSSINLENHLEIMKLLFDSMPFVFWKDKHGVYKGCNQNQAKSFGYSSPSEIVGKTIFEILDSRESAELVDKTDNEIMQNGIPITIEEPLYTPNGVRTYLSQKQPIFNSEGKVIGLLGIAMDVTDIKFQQKLAEEAHKKLLLEKHQLEIETKVEKKSQEKFKKLIENVLHLLNGYQSDLIHEKIGVDPHSGTFKNGPEIRLSKREKEILYYLSLNKSPKEIAMILSIIDKKSITYATILSIINKQLYPKFELYNCGELIQKAKALRLIPFILDSD